MIWYRRLSQQAQRPDFVALFDQDFLGQRKSGAITVIGAGFPVSLQKHDPLLVVFRHSDKRTGELGFRRIRHANGLQAAFEDGGIALVMP